MLGINSFKIGRMKSAWKLVILVFSLSALLSACAESTNPTPGPTGKWTWVSGSNVRGQAGIYGTQGTAAPSNVPGGRLAPVSWLDSSGKLWLFGRGYDAY
jgi:hypothetical protein